MQSIDEMNDVDMMTPGLGDRTWGVVESISYARPIRSSGHI